MRLYSEPLICPAACWRSSRKWVAADIRRPSFSLVNTRVVRAEICFWCHQTLWYRSNFDRVHSMVLETAPHHPVNTPLSCVPLSGMPSSGSEAPRPDPTTFVDTPSLTTPLLYPQFQPQNPAVSVGLPKRECSRCAIDTELC